MLITEPSKSYLMLRSVMTAATKIKVITEEEKPEMHSRAAQKGEAKSNGGCQHYESKPEARDSHKFKTADDPESTINAGCEILWWIRSMHCEDTRYCVLDYFRHLTLCGQVAMANIELCFSENPSKTSNLQILTMPNSCVSSLCFHKLRSSFQIRQLWSSMQWELMLWILLCIILSILLSCPWNKFENINSSHIYAQKFVRYTQSQLLKRKFSLSETLKDSFILFYFH